MRSLPLFAMLLAGCPASVIAEYEAAKEAALADPGEAPPNWTADAVLSISDELLDRMLAEALREGGALSGKIPIQGPLGVKGTVQPDLVVDSLELGPAKGCKDCLAVDAELSGEVAWVLGPARGTVPLVARIGLDAELDAHRGAEGWEVRARPSEVRRAEIDLGRGGKQVAAVADEPLREWVKEALGERREAIVLARFDEEDLPLRAVRILPEAAGVRVEMLTTAPEAHMAKPPQDVPAAGWQLDIAPQSLLAMARRTSFEAGPVSHDVVIEPTAITLSQTAFAMDMRLWRIKGKGWWRDYHTEGDVAVHGRRIELTPTEVEERGKSPGAVLVDPLAALGHGVILKAIEEALATSVPGVHSSQGEARTTEVRITEIDGTGAMIRLAGELVFTEPRPAKGGKVNKPR